MPRKRSRLNIRLPEGDVALLRAGAERLDISVSELVRNAAVREALEAVGRGGKIVRGAGDKAA